MSKHKVLDGLFGFSWGNMTITRAMLSTRFRVVTIDTPRETLEIYVTPTGKIRALRRLQNGATKELK